jgi:hypothetical protein
MEQVIAQKEISSNTLMLIIIKMLSLQAMKFVESLNRDFHPYSIIVLQSYSFAYTEYNFNTISS